MKTNTTKKLLTNLRNDAECKACLRRFEGKCEDFNMFTPTEESCGNHLVACEYCGGDGCPNCYYFECNTCGQMYEGEEAHTRAVICCVNNFADKLDLAATVGSVDAILGDGVYGSMSVDFKSWDSGSVGLITSVMHWPGEIGIVLTPDGGAWVWNDDGSRVELSEEAAEQLHSVWDNE